MPAGGQMGRYRLLGLLATGGMAHVFLALSGELSGFRTLVVVKRVLPHLASNPQFIQMFFDEARIAALLDHPNVVRIIEVGQDEEEYFLAMEVVQGLPLAAVLREGVKRHRPLTHAQAAYTVAQAANGLGYAHNLADAEGRQLNVVHRDVSPQNILVSFEGAVKVIDFGVARALGRVTETNPGGLKGKIHYMSPEQASAGHVDRRSDVFALGVVLWEALCGRRLFRRDGDMATLCAIIEEPIPAPSSVVPISPRLERIVMQALEKNPADRFQNAQEMALALERHAFATDGFSPVQVATFMKELFASDHARWKRTVAAAMNLDGAPEQWANTSGTFLRPHGVELRTHGSTLALQPTVRRNTAGPHEVPSPERSGDSRSSPSADFSLPAPPPRKSRRRLTLTGAALATLGGAIVFWSLLSAGRILTVTVVRPAASAANPIAIETLAAPPPVVSPSAAETQIDPSAALATLIPGPGIGGVTAPDQPEAVHAAVYDNLVDNFAPPAAKARSDKPARARKTTLPRAAVRGKKTRRHNDDWAVPETGLRDGGGPPYASSKTLAMGEASLSSDRGTDDPSACRIKVGTKPWSEVWIDGSNTGAHTPYTERIPCGTHRLTFKRPDLDSTRTFTFTVRAGETFKQSFPLANPR